MQPRPMNTYPQSAYRQPAYGPADDRAGFSLTRPLTRARDWLDARGKPAWIAAMVVAFIAAWPVGLGILGYMIWSNRMFSCRHQGALSGMKPGFVARHGYRSEPTGNAAFDAYRDETLKRLEDEHRAFLDFLGRLRAAKDKAEFDQFMDDRSARSDADRPQS